MRYFKLAMRHALALIILSLIAVLYSNCGISSQFPTKKPDGQLDSGNGTPYGGLLKSGIYIPASNQICNSDYQESLNVEIADSVARAYYQVPCEDREVEVAESDVVIDDDGDRIFYNNYVFAHIATARAQAKNNYVVACRNAEEVHLTELLVYGPGPIYTLEHAKPGERLQIYTTQLQFGYQYESSIRHAFVNMENLLYITETETPDMFLGNWETNPYDATEYSRMICDDLSGKPVNEWL